MRMKVKFIWMIIAAMVFCLSAGQPAIAASDEEAVLQVAENWAETFNPADFDAWSSLWWKSEKTTNFGPPKQMGFLTEGYEEIMSLVTAVFEYPKGTYVGSVHNPQATMLGTDVAVLTFYQTMSINPPAVPVQLIEQHRMTFVLQKKGGKWLIVHAHGSALPVE